MSFEALAEISVRDPLAEITRKERKYLLGLSAIAIAIVRTGLVPTRISALGVEFSQADQYSLLRVLSAVVCYSLVAFIVYAAADFVGWRMAHAVAYREAMTEPPPTAAAQSERESELLGRLEDHKREQYLEGLGLAQRFFSTAPGGDACVRWAPRISLLRSVVEFWVPIAIGVYAVAVLLMAHPSKPVPVVDQMIQKSNP